MLDEETTKEGADALLGAPLAGGGGKRSREALFGAFVLFWVCSFFAGLVGVMFWHGYGRATPVMKERERPSITDLAPVPPATIVVDTPQTETPPAEESAPATETTTPAVAKGELVVRVLNGGAPKGSAAVVTEYLKTAGFTKAVAGNADANYSDVAVYCLAGKEAEAKSLEEALKTKYQGVTIKATSSAVGELAQSPCTVVVGAGAR